MIKFLIKTIIVVLGIYVLLAFLPSLPLNINSTQTQKQNLFTVSAEAEAVAVPDLAKVTLGVEKKASLANQAQTEVDKVINDLSDRLAKLGVKQGDIKTSSYSLQPNYSYKDGKRTLDGFMAKTNVVVTSRDFDKLSQILEAASLSGVNTIGNLSLEIEDQDKLLAEARAEAIDKAKQKAKDISKESGLNLGRLVDVSVNDPGNYYTPRYSTTMSVGVMEDAEAVAPKIEPGESNVKVTVSLAYEIQ